MIPALGAKKKAEEVALGLQWTGMVLFYFRTTSLRIADIEQAGLVGVDEVGGEAVLRNDTIQVVLA